MTDYSRPPRRLVFARVVMAVAALILIALPVLTVAQYVAMAANGTHLAFSQEQMQEAGPQPAPMLGDPVGPAVDDEYSAGQYVDVPGVLLPLALGIPAAVGAVMTRRPGRRALIAGLAGTGAAVIAGIFPVTLIIWAAGYYRMGIVDTLPLGVIAVVPLLLTLAAFWGVVSSRGWFGSEAPLAAT